MEKKLTVVNGSVEFRDVVMELHREGLVACVRMHGFSAPTYTVLSGSVTLDDLFKLPWPGVRMEDFATALAIAAKEGDEVPLMDVFTL